MDDIQLLIDLHKGAERQGPGGGAESELALSLAAIDRNRPLMIADIGCGTGASTLLLARLLAQARITAVDFLPDFLEVLEVRAARMGLSGRITTLCASMAELPFGDEEFDVIWSEGAIYNIGFAQGVGDWRRYLKPAGRLVVSEITWTTAARPAELESHWEAAYAEVDVASAKIAILEQKGYAPLGYFVLPKRSWLQNHYRPMQDSFADFLERNESSPQARAIVEAESREIELFERYQDYFGYGVYVAKKLGAPALAH